MSGPSATDSMPTANPFYPVAWSFRTQGVAYVSRCMGMVAWDNPSLLTIPCWLSHGLSKMSSPDLTHNNVTSQEEGFFMPFLEARSHPGCNCPVTSQGGRRTREKSRQRYQLDLSFLDKHEAVGSCPRIKRPRDQLVFGTLDPLP